MRGRSSIICWSGNGDQSVWRAWGRSGHRNSLVITRLRSSPSTFTCPPLTKSPLKKDPRTRHTSRSQDSPHSLLRVLSLLYPHRHLPVQVSLILPWVCICFLNKCLSLWLACAEIPFHPLRQGNCWTEVESPLLCGHSLYPSLERDMMTY